MYAIQTPSVIDPKFMFMLSAKASGHLCIIPHSSEIVINFLQIYVGNDPPLSVVQMCFPI